DDCRVIFEDVPDHQLPALGLGLADQRQAFAVVEGQGLLDVEVLARVQGLDAEAKVRLGGRGDDDAVDLRVAQDGLELALDAYAGGGLPGQLHAGGVRLAHRVQGAQLVKDADEVLAPIAATDDGDPAWGWGGQGGGGGAGGGGQL